MNSKTISTVIYCLLLDIVRCNHCHDSVSLINRLNAFYRFDQHIYLMESSTDFNHWFPMSSLSCRTDSFTTQTVYTFNSIRDSDVNITEQEVIGEVTNKNTFLVVLIENHQAFGNGSQLLAFVKAIHQVNNSVKIGVFFTQSITSLDTIKQLFHWSLSVQIVNIFAAFHSSDKNGESSLNVFKFNTFGTFRVIDVTRSESCRDYFPPDVPNYHKHPLRIVAVREIDTNDNEMNFWGTVLRKLNASMSKVYVDYAQLKGMPGDIFAHEVEVEMIDPMEQSYLYPHRQTMFVMIVPHAQPYSDIIAYLQNRTWTLLLIYGFVVIGTSSVLLFVSGFVQKRNVSIFRCVTDVVNLLINDNGGIRYRCLHSVDVFVTVPLTFAGLIVMNGIVSIFQSYIMSPIYQPQINSLEDLYTSSIPIMVVEIEWKEKLLKLLEELTDFVGWSDKIHESNTNQLAKEIRSFNNSIAFFTLDENMKIYLEVQKRLALKAYHVLGEVVLARYLVSYKISSKLPFDRSVNDIVHRLNAAGLMDKWFKDENEIGVREVCRRNLKLQTGISNDSDMDTGKFSVPTAVWCGWIASVIVFICEIILHRIKSYTRRR